MSHTDNILKIGIILLLAIFFTGITFGEQIFCNNQNLSYVNNSITCFYTPEKTEYFSPTIEGTIFASKIEYTPRIITPNSSWAFKIYVDMDVTKEGMQKLIIKQDSFKQNFMINVSKKDIFTTSTNVIYGASQGVVILVLKNNSDNKLNINIKYNFPKSYSAIKDEETITLLGNSQVSLKIPFEYVNPDYSKGEIVFLYSLDNLEKVKKELIGFDPYKVPYQEKSNLNPYFLLSNNKVMLGLDVALLVVAIVLFTMFIGRLGKKIVKNNA